MWNQKRLMLTSADLRFEEGLSFYSGIVNFWTLALDSQVVPETTDWLLPTMALLTLL